MFLFTFSYEVAPRSDSEESGSEYEEEVGDSESITANRAYSAFHPAPFYQGGQLYTFEFNYFYNN